MSKKIVFKISNEGDVSIDKVEGYGSSCLEATGLLERAIGKPVESSRKLTDEYNEPTETDNSERVSH